MIIVVGSSKGLGQKLVELFSTQKKVLALARSQSFINSQNVISKKFDITRNQFEEIFFDVKKKSIEAIFFTIGLVNEKDNIDLENNKAQNLVNTNFLSVTLLVNYLIYKNKFKKNALICFFSSVTTFLPRDQQVYYCASKNSLNSYYNSLKFTLEKKKINLRVANLILGYLSSSMSGKKEKTIFKKYSINKLSKKIFINHQTLNGQYIIPKYWILIKIILNLMPSFLILKILKILKIK